MRVTVEALSPKVTPWKDGQTLSASSWSAVDFVSDMAGFPEMVRMVSHYDMEMVEFVIGDDGDVFALAVSAGWGSVSDQQGVNAIYEASGSPLRLRRDAKGGGPRIVNMHTGAKVATRD